MVFYASCWTSTAKPPSLGLLLAPWCDCPWDCIPAKEEKKLQDVVHNLLQAKGTPKLQMLESKVTISPVRPCKEGIEVHRTLRLSHRSMVCFPGSFVSQACCSYCTSETEQVATSQWTSMYLQMGKEMKPRLLAKPLSMEKLL